MSCGDNETELRQPPPAACDLAPNENYQERTSCCDYQAPHVETGDVAVAKRTADQTTDKRTTDPEEHRRYNAPEAESPRSTEEKLSHNTSDESDENPG